ncbi:MAG: hypothetical protein HY216_15670 [Candidatus Rokubacteria bacterium]|nr:hypothetical protein [Candidatus Rokubacteria bacterium]
MAGTVATELRTKLDAAQKKLFGQLEGMDPHLDKSDAPGQWTTREVLSHLMFEPGFDPVARLKSFHPTNLPTIEIVPGNTHLEGERKTMTLGQFKSALERQRASVIGYVESLPDAELQSRKARIPLFKQIMQTDEIPMATYAGALFEYHWNDHAGQLAKIRKAAGLPDAR